MLCGVVLIGVGRAMTCEAHCRMSWIARARAQETHFEGVNGAGRDVEFEWLSG
jgi:hypothetical protein